MIHHKKNQDGSATLHISKESLPLLVFDEREPVIRFLRVSADGGGYEFVSEALMKKILLSVPRQADSSQCQSRSEEKDPRLEIALRILRYGPESVGVKERRAFGLDPWDYGLAQPMLQQAAADYLTRVLEYVEEHFVKLDTIKLPAQNKMLRKQAGEAISSVVGG